MTDPPRFTGIPDIIYGTAFKFEKSASLVEAALSAGFRAVDTAGSKSAYREALVGEGIAAALNSGTIERKDLYVSTHFYSFVLGYQLHHREVSADRSATMHGMSDSNQVLAVEAGQRPRPVPV